jgi:hypothetical protein
VNLINSIFERYKLYIILVLYHSLFTYIFYRLLLQQPSDANIYWLLTSKTDGLMWSQLFHIGNSMMCWLNYPFAVLLKLPFWVGHILYGIIGFIAVLQYYKLVKHLIGDTFYLLGINVLPLLLFMPNLHFWSAGISKETLCFYAITTILLNFHLKNYQSIGLYISISLLVGIRPHIAFMLLMGLGSAYIIMIPLSRKRKLSYSLVLIVLLFLLYYMVSLIIRIEIWDIDAWLLNNQNWRDSFIGSGSYVPIQEYNYFYKFFTFYFRPLFYDIKNIYSWILSTENVILLAVFTTAVFYLMRCWKNIKWNTTLLGVFLFNLVGAVLYVERYAGLGIFARTRVMFLPFLVIVMLYIINNKTTVLYNDKV